MALLKKSSAQRKRKRDRGITLLEIALGMMILAVLSVGVSSLVKTGVESQLSERAHQYMQTVALNIVDDIRFDIRKADDVTVLNPQTLSLTTDASTVTYQLESGGKFSRSETGKPKKYYNYNATNNTYWNGIQMNCTNPLTGSTSCFEAQSLNADNKARQIYIPYLGARQPIASAKRTSLIDKYFDEPNYAVKDFSFDVPSATVFQ